MRKLIVAGNWKMNNVPEQARVFFDELDAKDTDCEMVIFPPSICWQQVKDGSEKVGAKWGLQHVHAEPSGAFTGEISIQMAKELDSDYVLIGHSERRQLFGETDADVALKTKVSQQADLVPMICLGETLEQREAGDTDKVITDQLTKAMADCDFSKDFVVAYEPVWAIGTGKVATPEIAEEAHRALRGRLVELAGDDVAEKTRILYGGSVKPENASELAKKENIDGFLVGGASLKPESFVNIIKNSN